MVCAVCRTQLQSSIIGLARMDRQIEPEWLDELPADDSRAIRSRRDLRRVNAWMGNARVIAAASREAFRDRPPKQIVDLGAGDGTLMLRVARRLFPRWRNVEVTLVDQHAIVSAETCRQFETLSWRVQAIKANVLDWLARLSISPVDLIAANLFLHHFPESSLARMMQLAAEWTDCFIACEPRRCAAAQRASRWLWLIGCSQVTCHDAVASVRAGFNGKELSALWPPNGAWQLQEKAAGWFGHCFVAQRFRGRRTSDDCDG